VRVSQETQCDRDFDLAKGFHQTALIVDVDSILMIRRSQTKDQYIEFNLNDFAKEPICILNTVESY
jgi:hypothetical protein